MIDNAQRRALRDAIVAAGLNTDLIADNGAIDATGYDEFVMDDGVRVGFGDTIVTVRREWPNAELEGLAAEYARSSA